LLDAGRQKRLICATRTLNPRDKKRYFFPRRAGENRTPRGLLNQYDGWDDHVLIGVTARQ
jgi:hypothetical protein